MAHIANLTAEQKSYLENAGIGDCIITGEQVKEAEEMLNLSGKSFEELYAIRNAVVRHLADIKTAAREAGDWGLFDQMANNLSGITCVIDNAIYA